jgi:hypothetical protein
MVAASMIAEAKEQSWVFGALGHDDFLGQDGKDAYGQKTADFDRGLLTGRAVATMLRELVGYSTERRATYFHAQEETLTRILELTARGALERGESVCLLLLKAALWSQSGEPHIDDAKLETSQDDFLGEGRSVVDAKHWVRVHEIVKADDGGLDVTVVWGRGARQHKKMSKTDFEEMTLEVIFGTS